MFLLKRGIRFVGKPWTWRHRVWLADRNFEHPAQRVALQSYINRLEQAESRRGELEKQIEAFLPEWIMAPVVGALQALKGIGLVIAATIGAAIGDFSRFANPRQLIAYLGLVPGEHSSGGSIRPRGITKAGNTMARSLLFEAAWSYRLPAKVEQTCWGKQHGMDQWLKDVSWRAQLRLTTRYRRLVLRGNRSQVAVTAVARELVGFVWSVATHVGAPVPA